MYGATQLVGIQKIILQRILSMYPCTVGMPVELRVATAAKPYTLFLKS